MQKMTRKQLATAPNLTVSQTATLLGVSVQTLRTKIKKKLIMTVPATQSTIASYGGPRVQMLIPRAEIERLQAEMSHFD